MEHSLPPKLRQNISYEHFQWLLKSFYLGFSRLSVFMHHKNSYFLTYDDDVLVRGSWAAESLSRMAWNEACSRGQTLPLASLLYVFIYCISRTVLSNVPGGPGPKAPISLCVIFHLVKLAWLTAVCNFRTDQRNDCGSYFCCSLLHTLRSLQRRLQLFSLCNVMSMTLQSDSNL